MCSVTEPEIYNNINAYRKTETDKDPTMKILIDCDGSSNSFIIFSSSQFLKISTYIIIGLFSLFID